MSDNLDVKLNLLQNALGFTNGSSFGAGVGVGILRGTIMFLRDLKDSESCSCKKSKIPRRSKIGQTHSMFSCCVLLKFTYVLRLSPIIQYLLKGPPSYFSVFIQNARRYQLFWTHQKKQLSSYSFLPVSILTVRILLEDNNDILPKCHFIFLVPYYQNPIHVSGRYCPHIQDFQNVIKRIFKIVKTNPEC